MFYPIIYLQVVEEDGVMLCTNSFPFVVHLFINKSLFDDEVTLNCEFINGIKIGMKKADFIEAIGLDLKETDDGKLILKSDNNTIVVSFNDEDVIRWISIVNNKLTGFK